MVFHSTCTRKGAASISFTQGFSQNGRTIPRKFLNFGQKKIPPGRDRWREKSQRGTLFVLPLLLYGKRQSNFEMEIHMKVQAIICTALISLFAMAAENTLSGFVRIPKNPGFAFANAIQERTPGRRSEQKAGEKSPIASDYWLAVYPVTNGGNAMYLLAKPCHPAS